MNTRISSAIETSVYVLVTVMTPRYSSRSIFFPPSLRQTPLQRNRSGGPPSLRTVRNTPVQCTVKLIPP